MSDIEIIGNQNFPIRNSEKLCAVCGKQLQREDIREARPEDLHAFICLEHRKYARAYQLGPVKAVLGFADYPEGLTEADKETLKAAVLNFESSDSITCVITIQRHLQFLFDKYVREYLPQIKVLAKNPCITDSGILEYTIKCKKELDIFLAGGIHGSLMEVNKRGGLS